ncbi:Pectinesterase [Rhynchospora pubera]|uniref:Pectinesterase n=1 Tax=Rhynchospora pubera TaxID=906938 RepID=A0AAV8GFG2_9POAL|nr:Pectinesterase [Rhynchospora pubera]
MQLKTSLFFLPIKPKMSILSLAPPHSHVQYSLLTMHPFLTILLSLLIAQSCIVKAFASSQHLPSYTHCEGTLYPELCASTLSTIQDLHKKSLPEIICTVVNKTADEVRASSANCSAYLHYRSLDQHQLLAINDCIELLDGTLDELSVAVSDLESKPNSHVNDVLTVLSASMTNQYTCLDGFSNIKGENIRQYIKGRLHHVSHLVSNSLAMVKKITPKTKTNNNGRQMREEVDPEAFEGYGKMLQGFPEWVGPGDRRLLQAPSTDPTQIIPDLTVAKDGSGNFTTISAAVAAAPDKSKKRFVIYIKAGAYLENVEVGKSKTNIMFVGDGIGKTVIKASRNVVDGWTTFRSATLAVVGNGFIGRDITVENAAGPSKHQAVALRVGSDLSTFYRCSFVGYQDTLYTHSLRQFYRECDIYGTIDFIFGNSAVVFQDCNLYARKPNPNQSNIYTAQGREDPNQNTGISIQKCKVTAASDLASNVSSVKTYLGRPWKEYSRTVFMQSYLDSLIDPTGWLPWNGSFALSTLYYGEYLNTGPGSSTANRVKWPGYRVITSATEANQFTVSSFIQGDQWISLTNVPFMTGLN